MKKGMISVNVILLFTVINMMFLSIMLQSAKLRQACTKSLRAKEETALMQSYKNLSRHYILKTFEKSLRQSDNKNQLKTRFRNNFNNYDLKKIYRQSEEKYFDLYPQSADVPDYDEEKIAVRILWGKKYSEKRSMTYYLLKIPQIDDEDIKNKDEKNIKEIIEKVKGDLIEKEGVRVILSDY